MRPKLGIFLVGDRELASEFTAHLKYTNSDFHKIALTSYVASLVNSILAVSVL